MVKQSQFHWGAKAHWFMQRWQLFSESGIYPLTLLWSAVDSKMKDFVWNGVLTCLMHLHFKYIYIKCTGLKLCFWWFFLFFFPVVLKALSHYHGNCLHQNTTFPSSYFSIIKSLLILYYSLSFKPICISVSNLLNKLCLKKEKNL